MDTRLVFCVPEIYAKWITKFYGIKRYKSLQPKIKAK